MLAGGTFQPHVSAACTVYNDWLFDDDCGGSGGRLIPVAALPVVDVDAAVAEVKRVAERGFRAAFVRTNPILGTKYSDRRFDALWQVITDTGMKLGLHPLPVWDQDGTARGFKLRDIMAASALGFPLDMMHTLYDMMAGGVFDRFPRMPTMILEAGCAGFRPCSSAGRRPEDVRQGEGARLEVEADGHLPSPDDGDGRGLRGDRHQHRSVCPRRTSRWRPTGRTTTARPAAPRLRKATGIKEEDVRMLATGTLERWFPSH
jgi:hypothetical protein